MKYAFAAFILAAVALMASAGRPNTNVVEVTVPDPRNCGTATDVVDLASEERIAKQIEKIEAEREQERVFAAAAEAARK